MKIWAKKMKLTILFNMFKCLVLSYVFSIRCNSFENVSDSSFGRTLVTCPDGRAGVTLDWPGPPRPGPGEQSRGRPGLLSSENGE